VISALLYYEPGADAVQCSPGLGGHGEKVLQRLASVVVAVGTVYHGSVHSAGTNLALGAVAAHPLAVRTATTFFLKSIIVASGWNELGKAFDVLQRLMAEVGVVQLSVVTAAGHEIIVSTLLDDVAVIHDDGPIGVLDGG